jgi:hypothetical protein
MRRKGSVPRALEERAPEKATPKFSNDLLLGEGVTRAMKKLTPWERDDYTGALDEFR